MNTHHLKIYPEHYNNVKIGTKKFEIRDNDRAFQKVDSVFLYIWSRNAKPEEHLFDYTSEENPVLCFEIGDVYPIDDKRVVFSLLEVKK